MVGRDPIVNPMQANVHRKLDEIARGLGEDCAEPAHREATLLISALRTVLNEHRVDPRGRCAQCDGRRWRMFGRRRRGRMPCRAYLAVQLEIGPADDDADRPPARHVKRRRTKLGIAS